MPGRGGRPSGRRIGRPPGPTKLTPELQTTYLAALKRCYYLETAADHVGITRITVYRWIKEGKRTPDSPQGQFCEAVRRVLAENEAVNLDEIQRHGATTWQALAWLCERSAPERWGTQNREVRELKKELAELKDMLGALIHPTTAPPSPDPEEEAGSNGGPNP